MYVIISVLLTVVSCISLLERRIIIIYPRNESIAKIKTEINQEKKYIEYRNQSKKELMSSVSKLLLNESKNSILYLKNFYFIPDFIIYFNSRNVFHAYFQQNEDIESNCSKNVYIYPSFNFYVQSCKKICLL